MDRATCEAYYHNPNLNISLVFVKYFVAMCMEDSTGFGGLGSSGGISDFATVIANEYFGDSMQIVLLYDESWDISGMIEKLTTNTRKAFVSYFLPMDEAIGKRIRTMPSDHFTHRLLPKANAFMVFVNDENGFENILGLISQYPWWNKRARIIVFVKEKSMRATKAILTILEEDKIFNGVVVTEAISKDNTTLIAADQQTEQINKKLEILNNTEDGNNTLASQLRIVDLQVIALEPYPLEGHSKESFVGRWVNGELTTIKPIFEEKTNNLRGNTLRICVFEFPPLIIKTEIAPKKYEYTGLEVALLSELARLLNFTFTFYEPPEGERWGTDLGNNTWSGLIGETQRHADFGIASVFLLDNREKAVDVSTPYDQDQGCFAVPPPEALQHWLGLVLPFSWQVWACVVSMALVAGPIFTLITRPLGMDRSMTVGRGIMYALGSLVSAQKAPHAKSHALRSFIVSWLIFCWLACILYRVALIVSLTMGPNAHKIDTLRQLARSGLEWGGYPEVVKTFSNTSDTEDEDMFERFQVVTNATAALERVATKGDFALLDSGKLLRYAANGKYFNGYSSKIHVTRECPTRYNVGIVMPIGSPFLEKVNELIRRLQNGGLIDKWYQNILHEAAIKNRDRTTNGRRERGLDIGDLKLCYVLILGGHFFSFLVLLGEKVLFWHRSGRLAKMGSSIIRKVSTISGLSGATTISSKGLISSANPSVIVTDTDDQESLRSLPLEVEHGWCNCFEKEDGRNDPVSASLGDIRAISCPHFKLDEE